MQKGFMASVLEKMVTDGETKRWHVLRASAVVTLCFWGIAESGYGLMQVLGWRSSRHALYALTGHFQNPGPFGGFIACVMAVAGAWAWAWVRDSSLSLRMTRVVNGIAWTALGMGLLVLPASMSRAGWLGLAVAMGVEWMRFADRSRRMTGGSRRMTGGNRRMTGGSRRMTREESGMTEGEPTMAHSARTTGLRSGIRWVAGGALCLALLAGAFLLKPDSALGRLHVWRMECWAIAERLWTGAGPGMGPWAYGEAQEAFFREHLETASPATVRVAGCPEYAYNEYLGLGVEYGLPALILSVLLVISAIVVLHRAGSPLAAGLTAWAVFAFASYPLAVLQLRILGAVFILGAIAAGALQLADRLGGMSEAKFRRGSCLRLAGLLPGVCALLLAGWMGFADRGRRMTETGRRMTEEGRRMTETGRRMTDQEEVRGVYAEGYALHQAGRYAESTKVLEEGARMSCDPMFEIIMGKNAEALGDAGTAATLYEKAHYMVPSRLYPLVRLMRLQIRQGRDEQALETARQIVAMPVNGRNAGMVRLHEQTQKSLDSLAARAAVNGK